MILETYVKNQKKFFLLPVLILIVSLTILTTSYITTGDIIKKDVSLKGGVSATIYTETPYPNLEQQLTQDLNQDFIVRTLKEFGTGKQIGFEIKTEEIEQETLEKELEKILNTEVTQENFSFKLTSSFLGESFYRQMLIAIMVSFTLMAIVIFITFRKAIPSLAVILSAFFDMVVTLAIVNLLNINISIAGIAAVILLMGYSIDTDVVMTVKVLKRKEGPINERFVDSMRTGLTMTSTTLFALTMAYFFSTSLVFQQMFLIIIIGLLVDIISTYAMNSNILMWYLKKQKNEN